MKGKPIVIITKVILTVKPKKQCNDIIIFQFVWQYTVADAFLWNMWQMSLVVPLEMSKSFWPKWTHYYLQSSCKTFYTTKCNLFIAVVVISVPMVIITYYAKKNWKGHILCFDPPQIVWKSPKMSHLNFTILAFSTIFWPIKTDMSGNTVWPQASGFQNLAKRDLFGHF